MGSGVVLLVDAAGVADTESGSVMVVASLEESWMPKDSKGDGGGAKMWCPKYD